LHLPAVFRNFPLITFQGHALRPCHTGNSQKLAKKVENDWNHLNGFSWGKKTLPYTVSTISGVALYFGGARNLTSDVKTENLSKPAAYNFYHYSLTSSDRSFFMLVLFSLNEKSSFVNKKESKPSQGTTVCSRPAKECRVPDHRLHAPHTPIESRLNWIQKK
jgi:hypothetical protein